MDKNIVSNKISPGRELNELLENKPKLVRGKVSKIYTHYINSLRQLLILNDRHTFFICVESIYSYHLKWAKHCFDYPTDTHRVVPLCKKIFKWKKREFIKMFESKYIERDINVSR